MRRSAFAGLGLGLLWGMVARLWMRLISHNPEFSWTGTLSILLVTTVSGLFLGLVRGARREGRRRWWRLAGIPALATFLSPGMVFLPAAVLGGWALSGRWPRWLRATVGPLGVAVTATLAWLLESSDEAGRAPKALPVLLGSVLLGLGVAAAGSTVLRCWTPQSGPAGSSLPAAKVDSADVDRQARSRAAHPLARARLVGRGPR